MVFGVKVPGTGFSFARLYLLLFLLIPLIIYSAFALGTSPGWRPGSRATAPEAGLSA